MIDPIPVSDVASFWEASPALRRLVRRGLGETAFAALEPRFAAMGRDACQRVDPLSRIADRESPRLVSFDALGRRIDRVDYHPAYREMEAIGYGSGIVALKYDAAFAAAHPGRLHLAGFTLGYLFGMAEAGLFCPICMTDGVARILSRHGNDQQKRNVLPRVASSDLSTLLSGAMFLTERWGGSDVGANRTVAKKAADGTWRLTGEKWFCSNVDAKAVLATARPEGAPEGTRGLATFLVLAEGNTGLRIRRLKEKLGVRSMPTGEVELESAEAALVGDFSVIAEMLNLSRLYNSIAASAILGRAALEARGYVEKRSAFGRAVARHPLAEETLLDLEAEHLFALHLSFEAVRALDRADAGDADAERLFRLLVPLVKAVTGKLTVPCVSEAMELIGGNGYIEESILPRLLRDGQVLPIWEGTTNILVLDFFRVVRKEGPPRPFLDRAAAAFPEETAGLERELPALAERDTRRWMDRLARLYGTALLLEAGETAAADRLRGRPIGLPPGARV